MQIWQIVAATMVSVAVLMYMLYLFWWVRRIMLIRWPSILLLRKYHVGPWAGDRTAEYKMQIVGGTLWWGYNTKNGCEFIIFSGRGHLQIMNWSGHEK